MPPAHLPPVVFPEFLPHLVSGQAESVAEEYPGSMQLVGRLQVDVQRATLDPPPTPARRIYFVRRPHGSRIRSLPVMTAIGILDKRRPERRRPREVPSASSREGTATLAATSPVTRPE